MSAPAAAPAATAAAPTAKHNPNWIRDIAASFLLAIALRAGFEIPFISAFLAIVIVFLTQVLLTDLKVGFQASTKGLKFTARVMGGVLIFITIRYLIAEVMGVYPVDSRNLLGTAKGLQGLVWSRDISKILMFEVVFAFVAGKLVANWVSEKDGGAVKLIFTTAFCILFLQFVVPTYTNSFPSWDQVGQKLEDRGLIGGGLDGLRTLAFGKSATPAPTPVSPPSPSAPLRKVLIPEFEGFTPVNYDIDWEFHIDTDGDPILMKFPGVPEPVRYSGKGEMPTPSRETGKTHITSGLPSNQPVRVRISRVKWMRQ